MASVATIEDNLIAKGLYECIPYYDDEPDEIIQNKYERDFFRGFKESEHGNEGGGSLFNVYDELKHKFYNKHTRLVFEGNDICIFHKKYKDPFSGKIYRSIDMFHLREVSIITEYYIKTYNTEKIKKCMFSHNNIGFILNIENINKKKALALKLIEKHFEKSETDMPIFPVELLNLICEEYISLNEFSPSNCELEYKDKFPEIVSKDQLKKLYDSGFVKLASSIDNYGKNDYIILSNDAFDSSDMIGWMLNCHFKTKERMHERKQEILNSFFN